MFLISAKKIGIDLADCAVVEDAKAGIEAAKAGGMTALAPFGDTKGRWGAAPAALVIWRDNM